MSGALNAWRSAVARQLRDAGLNAVTAMESAPASRWREPVAAVSLSRVSCATGAFQDYLGTYTDPESKKQRELYGREIELTLALDVYAPRDGGEGACREAAERAAQCLLCRGAAGAPVLEIGMEPVEFLERDGLYRLPVSCRCGAWLIARWDEEAGEFTDFEVKGRVK